MANSGEFVYLTSLGYTGTLADKRRAYFDDLIAGRVTGISEFSVPDAGEFVPSLELWNSIVVHSSSISSGDLVLCYFTAKRTETIATLTIATGSTAAAATPTLVRYGVYSVASNGDLTLVASTANDTTLFAATNTLYPKALSSSFSKTAGRRYAIGILVVSAAALPTFTGAATQFSGPMVSHFAVAPILAGKVAGQSDLPSSVATASISNSNMWSRAGIRLS